MFSDCSWMLPLWMFQRYGLKHADPKCWLGLATKQIIPVTAARKVGLGSSENPCNVRHRRKDCRSKTASSKINEKKGRTDNLWTSVFEEALKTRERTALAYFNMGVVCIIVYREQASIFSMLSTCVGSRESLDWVRHRNHKRVTKYLFPRAPCVWDSAVWGNRVGEVHELVGLVKTLGSEDKIGNQLRCWGQHNCQRKPVWISESDSEKKKKKRKEELFPESSCHIHISFKPWKQTPSWMLPDESGNKNKLHFPLREVPHSNPWDQEFYLDFYFRIWKFCPRRVTELAFGFMSLKGIGRFLFLQAYTTTWLVLSVIGIRNLINSKLSVFHSLL